MALDFLKHLFGGPNATGTPLNPQGMNPQSVGQDEDPIGTYSYEDPSSGEGTLGPPQATGTTTNAIPAPPGPPDTLKPHKSFGQKFLEILPYLATVGGGVAAMKGLGAGESLAEFGQGLLKSKLSNALDERKRQNELDDYQVKGAHQVVQDLMGADLSGTDIPEQARTRLQELYSKATADGKVTPKEAQELLALAHPIQSALKKREYERTTPEAKAVGAEKARFSTFLERAKALQDPNLMGPPRPPEDVAREMYQQDIDEKALVQLPTGGYAKPSDLAKLEQRKQEQLDKNEQADKRYQLAVARLAQGNSQFRDKMQWAMDRFGFDAVNDALRDAQHRAVSRAAIDQNTAKLQQYEDEEIAGALKRIGGEKPGGPVVPAGGTPKPTPKKRQLAPGVTVTQIE